MHCVPGMGGMRDTVTRARGQHVFASLVSQLVRVLNRHDGRDAACQFELRDADVQEAEMANFPRAPQIGERSNRLREWHVGIRRMQLIQIDALQPQALRTAFNGTPQMVGAPIRDP